MQLQESIKNVFVQLSESLRQLTPEQYSRPSTILFDATIGQHVRHIIELFTCLDNGYDEGIINYEKRKRDKRIETNKDLAIQLLHNIYNNLGKANKTLVLGTGYDESEDDTLTVSTNYYREIVYNLEHTVHHMALVRVGINEVSKINVGDSFGVASSTIKYRNACAQ